MMLYRSLQGRLLLPFVCFLGVLFGVTRLYDLYLNYNNYEQNLIERVSILSRGVAFNLSVDMTFQDVNSAKETILALAADHDIEMAALSYPNGEVFVQYIAADLLSSEERWHPHQQTQGHHSDSQHIHVFVPVTANGESLGLLEVIARKNYIGILNLKAIQQGSIEFLLLGVMGFLFYKYLEKKVVKPITALNQSIQGHIENRTSVARLQVNSKDELGQLVSAFNTMISRLNQREEQVAYTLDRLEQEKYFANEVIQTVQHALIVVSQDGKIILHNQESVQFFKPNCQKIIGSPIFSVLNVCEGSELMALIEKGIQIDDRIFQATNEVGDSILVKTSTRHLINSGKLLLAIEDVTEIESAMKQLQLAAGVFENIQDGIMVLDDNFNVTATNPAIKTILGYDNDELLGVTLSQLIKRTAYVDLANSISIAVEQCGHWHGELIESHKQGHDLPLLVKVTKLNSEQSGQDSQWLVMITDLSESKEMERLSYLAHHDVLTGLANRTRLYAEVEKLQSSESFEDYAILYADLDGFKKINDQFGHDAGDEVLKVVGRRLKAQVRVQDLVSRLAGDEFIIILRSCERAQLGILAERVVTKVAEPIGYNGLVLNVGISVGAYWSASPEVSASEAIKVADTAMYQAKNAGKGRVIILDSPKDID
ncbi:diguanylate cyclase [Vibrio sp. FNV 38]|nr:diguanylate cyclase [Vibrio sp. FNV 38]